MVCPCIADSETLSVSLGATTTIVLVEEGGSENDWMVDFFLTFRLHSMTTQMVFTSFAPEK